MSTLETGIRLVPKRDRRPTLLWHVADGWPRAFGTRATSSDVARRWQLDASTCEQLLAELADRRVIVAGPDGSYDLARAR